MRRTIEASLLILAFSILNMGSSAPGFAQDGADQDNVIRLLRASEVSGDAVGRRLGPALVPSRDVCAVFYAPVAEQSSLQS